MHTKLFVNDAMPVNIIFNLSQIVFGLLYYLWFPHVFYLTKISLVLTKPFCLHFVDSLHFHIIYAKFKFNAWHLIEFCIKLIYTDEL